MRGLNFLAASFCCAFSSSSSKSKQERPVSKAYYRDWDKLAFVSEFKTDFGDILEGNASRRVISRALDHLFRHNLLPSAYVCNKYFIERFSHEQNLVSSSMKFLNEHALCEFFGVLAYLS